MVWTGHLSEEKKRAAFAAARLFVLVSVSENFGIAPVEAMATGVPIILSAEVAISSAVREHDAGVVVSRNSKEIAAAVVRLSSDYQLEARLISNGRRLVQEFYSPAIVGSALAELYTSVINTKRP